MQVDILKENLAYALSLVSRAVATRAANPALEHVLLATEENALRLAATDLELAIMCAAETQQIAQHGATMVHAKRFADFISTLTEQNVRLTFDPESRVLVLEAGNTKARFHCMDADEFPPLPRPDMDGQVVLDAETFREIVEQVAFAAAKEEARPVLTGVSLRSKEGKLYIAATDGFRLSLRTVEPETPVPDGWDVILPARTFKELDRIVAKTDAAVHMAVLQERRQMAFRTGPVDVLSQLIEGAYPQYEPLIPTSYRTRLVVSRDLFLNACRQAQIFTRERFNEAVRLEIEPGEEAPGILRVIARDEELGETATNLPAVVEGEPITIGFNVRFLREALDAMPTADVALELTAPASPAVLRPVGREDFLHLIMPMQLT